MRQRGGLAVAGVAVGALIEQLDELKVFKSNGVPARHQPLLLLWGAGRVENGLPRTAAWGSVRAELVELLRRFSLPGARATPEYPFVALTRTPFWELTGHEGPVPAAHGSVTGWLTANNPEGGLRPDVYDLLARQHRSRNQFVRAILRAYFPGEDCTELLEAVGISNLGWDEYGEVPWVAEGVRFARFEDAYRAGVHGDDERGIAGDPEHGATSVLVPGEYEDDVDLGDIIIYTVDGGRDQEKTRGNAALIASCNRNRPVRVIRRIAPPRSEAPFKFRYDGLFQVKSWTEEIDNSGSQVYRFWLVKFDLSLSPAESGLAVEVAKAARAKPPGNAKPSRSSTVAERINRSLALADWVKEINGFTCQVCHQQLAVPGGFYAEAAHIRPVGAPWDGPDEGDNMLCLCPNDHKRLDRGAIAIGDDLVVYDTATGKELRRLRTVAGHDVEVAYLAWHRERYFKRPAS